MKYFKDYLSEKELDGLTVPSITKNLRASTNLPTEDEMPVGMYTINSGRLNGMLIAHGHPFREEKTHNAIIRNAKPSGHSVTLHSGVSEKFADLVHSNKGGIIHSPAHISTTHDPNIAYNFTKNENGVHNLINIKIKPQDRILHVSKYSSHKGEHETIIPAGTKLKHEKTEISGPTGRQIHTHHFIIHDQSDIKESSKPSDKLVHEALTSDNRYMRYDAADYENLQQKQIHKALDHHIKQSPRDESMIGRLLAHKSTPIETVKKHAHLVSGHNLATIFVKPHISDSDHREIASSHPDADAKEKAEFYINRRNGKK